ncbi:MAG TPA: transketolase [Candidatus Eisenbacteria bacterium]
MSPTSSKASADPALDRLAVNTIRFLAVDAVEKARSGHPGLPMGMADVGYMLWTRFMRHDPADPSWPGRDRFVLSAGHGSMLLYALLHVSGYDLPMEELQRFRQLGSRTPGHPEYGLTPGVETTTGPLGQGLGNAVGMALASRMADARFAAGGFSPGAYRVFAIAGDGCMMEGISHEAASFAGHLQLGNLVVMYDDNHITIDGNTSITFSDDTAKRFEAYGWQVLRADPYDPASLAAALESAVGDTTRPSLVVCRSHIGYGAPKKQDTAHAHGEPLGPEETVAAKRALGWPESPAFLIPPEVRAHFAARAAELAGEHTAWNAALARWRAAEPARAAAWDQFVERRVPRGLTEKLCESAPTTAAATRVHGNVVMQKAAALVPSLVGGSADLVASNRTNIAGSPNVTPTDFSGRNICFGVREHGMTAIASGLALAGFIPFSASFLTFTDYARPGIRLAALMRIRSICVYTHDSVFLGEDGPTHQAVEHLAALRLIPNLLVIRPADGLETAAAWGMALERHDGPTLLALSRQTLPALARPAGFSLGDLRRGAYLLRDSEARDPITFIATGSEVGVAVDAAERLATAGTPTRVVSMPAPQLFLAQDEAYRRQLLPAGGRRVSIEAGVTDGWRAIVGERGLTLGIDRFGESAPAEVLAEHFGLTGEAVARRVREWATRA